MFSTDVVDSDSFLDMPVSARCLYYDLGMRADDDGFVNPRKVVRLTSASEDDLKVLAGKKFIIPFNSGVIVIKDWKMNNYIQSDRYVPTIYHEEKKQLLEDPNRSYFLASKNTNSTKSIQNVYKMDTQVRLGKVRLGKDKKDIPPFIPPTKKTVAVIRKKYSSLKDIDEDVLLDIAKKYNVPIGLVELNFEKMKAWLESNGKVKKDYRATLRGFVLRDVSQVGLRRLENKKEVVDATSVESL